MTRLSKGAALLVIAALSAASWAAVIALVVAARAALEGI